MTYVSPSDAWDYTRISRELGLIRGEKTPAEGEVVPWVTEADHPINRYRSGESRFDLDTVREYLLPDAEPTEFKLRRMSVEQVGDMIDYIKSGRQYRAMILAMSYSLVEIRGLDFDLQRRGNGPISASVLDDLRLTIGDEEWALLGAACCNANTALTVAEKKS